MSDRLRPEHVTILGGGLAGLSAGYYARKSHLSFSIYEAKNYVGGNSTTIRHGDFLFDSGPHLLQTKDFDVTSELKELLHGEFNQLALPVQTYVDGKLLDFPFSALNLLENMGLRFLAKAMFEIAVEKLRTGQKPQSFEEFAVHSYGRSMADRLLLNYSEKLWGKPCSKLSRRIAGQQLRGLSLKTFLVEVFGGREARIEHIGGTMCYPLKGFGTIVEKLADACGRKNLHTNSRVTSILHADRRIRAIELNEQEKVNADQVLSTLPLNLLVQMLNPEAPEEILAIAQSLQFRSLVLVVLFLRRSSISASSSIHFPDPQLPFTRIHEPKNRSKYMAPSDQTSMVAEIPCQENDRVWDLDDQELIGLVQSSLLRLQWIRSEEVIDGLVVRLNNAYPILDIDYEQKIQRIRAYLNTFSNLKVTGRTGSFAYISLHHIMKSSKKVIAGYIPSSE